MRTHFTSSKVWLIALGISLIFLGGFFWAVTELFIRGVGIWGLNSPVFWAFAITNFVWWVGIGHAGTFISAILFLVKQEMRTAISRVAETMTIFAVMCAGLFPIFHLGRPWFFYWLFPYYDTMEMWPQFRSPLVWDVFAVSTYLLISVLFWFLGLIPDLAIYRDQSRENYKKVFYGILAMGWHGSSEQWRAHRTTYTILAAIAAPLVISVHSLVGLDFAASLVSGWHSTIFPPYFVGGAIFSGFAMVITIAIPIRSALGLESVLTIKHLDLCAKFILAMGIIVAYGYLMEVFSAYVSQDLREIETVRDHYLGPYAPLAWLMIFCNVVTPQILWFSKMRSSLIVLFLVSIFINIGMWLERFMIIVASLYRTDLTASAHLYSPTRWDWMLLLGSLGLFSSLYLIFARVFPIVAISEVRKDGAPL